VNYISFAPGGYDPRPDADRGEFHRWWPATIVIGKDILIPAHGIYWMIMLHALGLSDADMPRLVVHGWWNSSGAKMSKSLGNVVDPTVLAGMYGPEALRYYLMCDIPTGKDADFSEERLVEQFNAELANSLGNLLNRTLSMSHRYRAGVLSRGEGDAPLRGQAQAAIAEYCKQLDAFQVHAALAAIGEFATACNTYVEMTAPWKLAKDPERAATLDHVLYALAESPRIIAVLISPVLPQAAAGILHQLNWQGTTSMPPVLAADASRSLSFSLSETGWGALPDDHKVGKPVPLFPRIESPAL
jgi:methionyl-tRNA synthetase